MSAFLSKYGVARHIYIPVVKRAVVDFAVGADWTPAAGDVKISKDGGAAANVTNLPSAIAMGNGAIWDFSLTATEMQAAQIIVTVADSATKVVEDQSFIIETHGHASAQYQVDLADSVRAGLTALPNAAAGANTGLPVVGTQVPNATSGASGGLPVIGTGSNNFKSDSSANMTVGGFAAGQGPRVRKNVALAAFMFVMTDSTNHNPATGKTVTAQRSIDGGALASCANSVSEIGSGLYQINLAASDLNGDTIMLRFTATSCDDLPIEIITNP